MLKQNHFKYNFQIKIYKKIHLIDFDTLVILNLSAEKKTAGHSTAWGKLYISSAYVFLTNQSSLDDMVLRQYIQFLHEVISISMLTDNIDIRIYSIKLKTLLVSILIY